jgi:hypothetical protein
LLWSSLLGVAILFVPASSVRAQAYGTMAGNTAVASPYRAPGVYATTWGVPSFGWPRTYTAFSSPYGPGYGYGYYPYSYVPGYYGFRLWRPGFAAPGYVYGAGYYGTVSTPYQGLTNGYAPPIGVYAGGFGAPPFVGW